MKFHQTSVDTVFEVKSELTRPTVWRFKCQD